MCLKVDNAGALISHIVNAREEPSRAIRELCDHYGIEAHPKAVERACRPYREQLDKHNAKTRKA